MPVVFRGASLAPLRDLTASVPAGAIVGIIGLNGSGQEQLLQLAAGLAAPSQGQVEADSPRKMLGACDPIDLDSGWDGLETLALFHTLGQMDSLTRAKAPIQLEKMRRRGASILLASHESHLIERHSDEVWWLDRGRLAAKGDPREVLDTYQRDVLQQQRAWARTISGEIPPAMRRGDGRARLLALEALDEHDRLTTIWQAGTIAGVRVTVRFENSVPDPVVGILIRSRVGLDIYGTNTELENLKLGPVEAGEVVTVTFRFECTLCPQECTLTAASHDPDGVWHDWLEDGLMVEVTDIRHTAGVVNLKARAEVARLVNATTQR